MKLEMLHASPTAGAGDSTLSLQDKSGVADIRLMQSRAFLSMRRFQPDNTQSNPAFTQTTKLPTGNNLGRSDGFRKSLKAASDRQTKRPMTTSVFVYLPTFSFDGRVGCRDREWEVLPHALY